MTDQVPVRAKKPFKALDPLKYALRSIISLWYMVLGLGICFFIINMLSLLSLAIADMLFNASKLNILSTEFFENYVRITQIAEFLKLLPVAPWPVWASIVVVSTILTVMIEVGLMETALTWYDTQTSSFKNLIPRSYNVVAVLITWRIITTIGYSLTSAVSEPQQSLLQTILSLIFFCITVRYFFSLYYMIDTKTTLRNALQHTKSVLWRLKFLDIFLYLFLFIGLVGLILPFWITQPIGVWIITFATVYMYRALFPRDKTGMHAEQATP